MQGGAPPDLSATMRVPGQASFGITAGGFAVSADSKFLLQSPSVRTTGPDATGRLFTYAPAYYPSSATAAQATSVVVGSGDERTGIDIALKFVPTSNISGRLLTPEGPAANYALHLVPSNTGDMTADPDVAVAITDGDGSFMLLAVPAGQYVIQTVRPPRARAVGDKNGGGRRRRDLHDDDHGHARAARRADALGSDAIDGRRRGRAGPHDQPARGPERSAAAPSSTARRNGRQASGWRRSRS